MSKILVTGSCGFIGKYLVRALARNPKIETIECVDDLSSGMFNWQSIATDRQKYKEKITFIQTKVEDYNTPPSECNHIYHLAAPVGPVGVLKKAGRISTEIISDLNKMANLALEYDCPLTYISTSEVYGESAIFSQPEDINKIVPSKYTVRLEYGVAKLLGEIMLSNISKVLPLKYIAIRPFNIAGPGQNGDLGFVIPRFCRQVINGENITIYGDGTDRRTFTSVTDFVDATLALTNEGRYNTVFNIGNPENQTTIAGLARKVLEVGEEYGFTKSELSFVNPKDLHGDTFEEAWNKIPNVDRLQAYTGFKFKDSINTIVRDSFEYERQACL